jgi:unsaturated chondroitin disaccharide hydrolase
VGVGPESSQPFDQYRTTDFCVGAFLLAASEVGRLACGRMPQPGELSVAFGEGWWAHRGFIDGNRRVGSDSTGQVTVEFDVVPYSTLGVDGVVGYADTSVQVDQYGDHFALVRMYGGAFDAYDLDRYRADVAVPFVPGASHHVRMEVDLPAERYDVWVSPPDGAAVQIADDYRFRAAAGFADDLGQVTLISAINGGDFVVYNHSVVSP